jgi:AhpD family alkylhydroperoxidase
MESRLNFYRANPDAMKAISSLDDRISRSGLEPSLVNLIRLRTSQINGCAYCLDLHTAEASAAGERAQRLATLAVWRDTPFFADRERAALAWAEAVTQVADTHVPDAAWELASAHFTPAELVDLTLLIGTMNLWNRFAVAFRKQPVLRPVEARSVARRTAEVSVP